MNVGDFHEPRRGNAPQGLLQGLLEVTVRAVGRFISDSVVYEHIQTIKVNIKSLLVRPKYVYRAKRLTMKHMYSRASSSNQHLTRYHGGACRLALSQSFWAYHLGLPGLFPDPNPAGQLERIVG